jgi:hypothetical protein
MAKFRIWCRTDQVGQSQFVAVVSAIPESGIEQDQPIESDSRLVASLALANESCVKMIAALKQRIHRRGDEVTITESV